MKSWISAILSWTVILGMTAVLAAAVVVPRLAGATPYTVLTGSMRPGMPPGTLVVVKPVAFDRLRTGDVVTYQLESGKPTVVTHRVIAIGVNGAGDRVLQTQGDANDRPDANSVREVQVRGKAWYSVPYLGHLNNLLTSGQRQWVVYGVVVVLIGYALAMWIGAARDRTRRRNDKEKDVIGTTATSV
ncbi:signal peptidase I [Microlunatus soli]|uniref:Signal peptidase I n=1 Tax=Microlunatus soli TaxID=630515 RepID=A0A1H1R0K7_9ACTN|nr:signal peptidase I [Microlunatus soli]SDS29116.1 signal peptidase, endoplasmic reticulum-type [Microlunatus soli]